MKKQITSNVVFVAAIGSQFIQRRDKRSACAAVWTKRMEEEVFRMWDFLPMERDEYVSAEDDAVAVEQARENARMSGENPAQGICPFCNKVYSLCACDYCPSCKKHNNDCECDDGVFDDERGPEFSQEYEAPEDVYAEADASDDW